MRMSGRFAENGAQAARRIRTVARQFLYPLRQRDVQPLAEIGDAALRFLVALSPTLRALLECGELAAQRRVCWFIPRSAPARATRSPFRHPVPALGRKQRLKNAAPRPGHDVRENCQMAPRPYPPQRYRLPTMAGGFVDCRFRRWCFRSLFLLSVFPGGAVLLVAGVTGKDKRWSSFQPPIWRSSTICYRWKNSARSISKIRSRSCAPGSPPRNERGSRVRGLYEGLAGPATRRRPRHRTEQGRWIRKR